MSGAQTSSFYPVNQLLVDNAQQISNQYAPQRNELFIQKAQQEIGSNEIEYAARAAQGLLSLGDEAAMAAAYPGAVASAQQLGFLKNAPSVFPGKARMQQIAAMGISAEKQYEQQGVAGDYQTWLAGRGRGTATSGAAAPGYGGGGGSSLKPFVAANLPAGVTPEVDQLVRTVYGEANGQPLAGQQAVAHVVLNRAKGSGESVEQVIFKPHQFEPWNSSRRAQLEGLDPNSPEYQRILTQVVQPVLAGQAPDPTGGATHFLNPALVTSRGDQIPGWASGNRITIGAHDFYYAPYGGGGQRGGVAARTGGTDVAGPAGTVRGAPSVPAPVTIEPETGVPVVASPGAPPGAVAPGAAPVTGATAQPPPAVTPAAPVANIPPPPPRLQNGLTVEQDKTIRDLEAIQPRNRADFVAQQKLIATTEQTYRQHNETVDRQYQTDQRLLKTETRLEAEARQRQEKAARDAKAAADEAARTHRGTGLEAQDISILEKGDDGSRTYAGAYNRMATKRFLPDGSEIRPDMSAYDPPTFKGKGGEGGMTKAPVQAPPTVVTGMIENASAVRQVDKTLTELERRGGSGVGFVAGNTPAAILNRTDPEGVTLRGLIADIGSLKLHDRSGAAVSASEAPRLVPFIPSVSDPPAAIRDKLRKFRSEYLDMLNDTYQIYGPAAGGKQLQPIEDVLKGYQPVAPQGQSDMPRPKSEDEYKALPSGTSFIDPKGTVRVKP